MRGVWMRTGLPSTQESRLEVIDQADTGLLELTSKRSYFSAPKLALESVMNGLFRSHLTVTESAS